MKTPIEPMKFFSLLNWLDGQPLLDLIEPYRQKIFSEALYTLDEDDTPKYNLVLAGRAKKNWKSADLILAALYRLLAWPSPLGTQCYILANDKGQANDDLELCKKIIKANKLLRGEVKAKSDSIVRRDGDGFLEILPAGDVIGMHGKTYSFCGFDEIHGQRTYDLLEALALDPHRLDAMMWITSYASLFNHRGIPLYDLCSKGKEGADPRMYFSWYSADYCTDPYAMMKDTPEARANPSTLPEGYLEQQKSRLPIHRYRRLHLNLPGAPEGAYLNADKVEAAIGTHKILPFKLGLHYRAFVDMSGGSGEDATLSIAHSEDGRVVVDGIWNQGQRPPFNPRKAVNLFIDILKGYNLTKVTGDHYAGETFKSDFEGKRIHYDACPLPKSALYEALEVELNSSRVCIPDDTVLLKQLLTLVMRGGKIDHLPGEMDDYANAVAGAVWLNAKGIRPMTVQELREGSFTGNPFSATRQLKENSSWSSLQTPMDDYYVREQKNDRWDW